MKVHRLDEIPDAPEGRSVALGTFDGVHLGHRLVIESARDWGRDRGTRTGVVTFDPHPLQILRPDEPPKLLSTTALKIRLIEALDVDEVIVIPFTEDFSRLEPDDFSRDVLARRIAARHVSVGANFRFGHRAAGDADHLRSRTEFETEVVPLVEHDGEPVSSSRIRELVARGAVDAAAELLGAPFVLEGTVVTGDARGRELDMPTANVESAPELVVPATGIYAARALVTGGDGRAAEGAAAVSIGVRPTFEDAGDLRVEAHLIDFDGDLYGRTMQLAFLARLRDEERFDSPEALIEQMRKDVEEVRRLVASQAQRRP
jgi:riboflavin kinase/FMN adenylyltransferase